MADVPADDAWLSPREAAWVARMRFPKRRCEFRLGRWTAKVALALYLDRGHSVDELRSIEIDRAKDGAPAPLVEGRPAEAFITMTDRADQAVCLVGPPGTALGCDLELVEPRSDAFVGDYLTTKGQAPSADYKMIEDLGFEIAQSEQPGCQLAATEAQGA